ncbi:hemicentin-1-like [Glandiceps talaboti]
MQLRYSIILQLCIYLSLFATNWLVSSQRGDVDVVDYIAEASKRNQLEREREEARPPVGASTLAFVFDVTGSMYDDLVQVIEGAAKILATTLSRRDKPLYNYALVPFHDPEIGPVTITTDPEYFKRQLRDLYVQGGGDCPEMSIGAIEEALKISLPSSFIYVFTDARSKDFNVTDSVLKLIQEKQSQVVFVMTGDCGNTSHEGFQVYQRIATTSSGQLFMLNKSDVDEVLNFVRLSIASRKVQLITVDYDYEGTSLHTLPIDQALKEFTVSVSGDNPSIMLEDPMGRKMTKENGLLELLKINNVYVVSVKKPKPGLWKLTATSQSKHQVRVTGVSTLDFIPGYSKKPVYHIDHTSRRPIVGLPTYLILNATGLMPPGIFTKVELINRRGVTLKEFPLQMNMSNPVIYTVPKFIPPNEYYYLRVVGIDRGNYLFQRLSAAAVIPQVPTAPVVTMPPRTPGYYGEVAVLTCHVDSLVPYSVQWTRGNMPLAPALFYEDVPTVTYNISNANAFTEGYYECRVINSAGEGKAETFLDVTEPPPEIDVPQNVSVLPGGNGVLTCTAFSSVQFNITWTRPDSFAVLSRHPRIKILSNGSLEVSEATQGDGGRYRCIASNEGGSSYRDVHLFIQESPKVSVSTNGRNVTFRAGQNFTISCSARGFPAPEIYWRKDGNILQRSSGRIQISEDGDLQVYDATEQENGLYSCVARNPAGTDKKTIKVTYIEAPFIRITKRRVLVEYGQTATLECPSEGEPAPTISWYKNGFTVLDKRFTTIKENGDLTIVGAQKIDSGDYTCVATNDAGSDTGVVALDVGSKPSIREPPLDAPVDIGSNLTLPCVALGYPQPVTTWYKEDGSLEDNDRISVTESGSLSIRHLQLEDEGTYVCVVTNQFGTEEVSAYIRITGIVRPVIGYSNPQVSVTAGSSMTLTCQILIGNPPPAIQWLRDDLPIDFRLNPSVRLMEDSSLVVSDVRLIDAGKYTCFASNVAGNGTFVTTVTVHVPPSIRPSPNNYTATQYSPVKLSCPAEGIPPPSTTWQKDGELISPNDPYFYLDEEGSLHIPRVHSRDSGMYVCMVSNPAGVTLKDIKLHVQVPPFLTGVSPEDISVTVGESVELPCAVKSTPPPVISWNKNEILISENNLQFAQLGTGSLSIRRVRVEDSGIYTCVAVNVAGNLTKDVRLKVNVPPIISGRPVTIHAIVGEPIILPCESIGDPVPTVRWNKNNREFDASSHGTLLLESGSLQLGSVQPTDSGLYKCTVTNIAGSATRDITLIVQEPPRIKEGIPNEVKTLPNNAVILPCPTTGYPRPEIKWFKDGHEVETGDFRSPIRVWGDGSLLFTNPMDSDEGEYECRAFNEAGNATKVINLKIHKSPKIKDGPEEVSVNVNDPAILECEVSGDPIPKLTWKRNGIRLVIDDKPTFEILRTGSLRLPMAQKSDGGRYSCFATNIAGQVSRDILLIVLEPPVIHRPVPNEFEELDGSRIVLSCPASGYPIPHIKWYKDDEPIGFSPTTFTRADGALIISSATREDTGEYKCVVSNKAGNDTREISVKVLIPPTIKPGPETIDVLIGKAVTLPCEAEGVPQPMVSWEKTNDILQVDGQSVQILENKSLFITDVRHSDGGKYMCVASNKAGVTTRMITLNIQEHPSIVGPTNRGGEKFPVTAGEEIILPCKAKGVPIPDIAWLKDDQRLTGFEYGLEIQDDGSLRIFSGSRADTGTYTCIASNVVGNYTHTVEVIINELPFIRGGGSTELVSILGEAVILPCETLGIPMPHVTWQKDNQPLLVNGQIRRQLESGSLQIYSTREPDSGRYICTAHNVAGIATRTIILIVQEPPRIATDTPRNVTVIVNEDVQLRCIASGIPEPTVVWLRDGLPVRLIYWLKDGRPLHQRPHGISISSGGRLLQIPNVQITDAGRYKCVAVNAAGNGTKVYDVIVHVPPSIDENEFPTELTAIEGRPVTLECDSSAIPPPRLIWLRNGQPITPNDRGIKVTGRGRYLDIQSIEEFHEGQYMCFASNIAGNSTRIFNIHVQTSPDIEGSGIPNDIKVIQNNPVALECPADADPPPDINWFKDNHQLSLRERGMRILRRNTLLQIYSAQVTDSGRYQCVATNVAGNNSKSFNVEVLVPPSISEDDRYIAVSENADVFLPCEVLGIPPPKVTWHKGDVKLTANGGSYTFHESGSLSFSSASVSDSDDYTCHASNPGGNVTRIITLEIQVPPSIEDRSAVVKTALSSSVRLECQATGSPKPRIYWHRGHTVLNEIPRYEVDADGSLTLESTGLSDAGTYMCVARSVAGSDMKRITLVVQVTPTILEEYQNYIVIEDQLVTMKCTARGTPSPITRWQKDFQDISRNDIKYRILPNGWLQIPFARKEDTGMFKCIAENDAGSAEQLMNLQVQVPPSILPSPDSFTVVLNKNIGLPCVSDGIPIPTISWEKDGISVDQRNGHRITDDGTLQLFRTQVIDSGTYVCTAINEAGRDSSEMLLSVQVPPKFTVLPSEQEVVANGRIHLECEAVGVPVPDITWTQNGEDIPNPRSVDGRSELIISHVRKQDEGTYACLADNPAGTRIGVAAVRIKIPPLVKEVPDSVVNQLTSVLLPCEASGDPQPDIFWYKNDAPVRFSNRIRQLQNGSIAIYGAISEDAGDYVCRAVNNVGAAEGRAKLSVRNRPEFTIEPPEDIIVDLGDTILADCIATGEPEPTMEWWFGTSKGSDSVMILSGDRISILSNNSLRIVAARLSDTAGYACKAINMVGAVSVITDITVRVHGDWSDWKPWGVCSVTCGEGIQTRTRSCDNPTPANGGRQCRGEETDNKACNPRACPINGQWGSWMPWEECTKTCGQGSRSRSRLCNDPPPQFGGRSCQGTAVEQVLCNIKPCPVDGNWGVWSAWQQCSETCGEGTKLRTRQCNNPPPRDGGLQCPGSATQSQTCKVQICAVNGKWSLWSPWSMCSKSCGTGERHRQRTCTQPTPQYGGRYCEGMQRQVDFCNTDGCPVHGGWSRWEEWGECSRSCNGGQQKRYRTCNNPRPSNGGRACPGTNANMRTCNLQMCPIDGEWSQWGEWGQCSKSCGEGSKIRYRSCTSPAPRNGGRSCPGDDSQRSQCSPQLCRAGPNEVVGNVIGEINDIDFGVSPLVANITTDESSTVVTAQIYNVPSSVGFWMRKLISLITPIYWTTAFEIGEAVNGYTLTKAYFERQTQVEFATGEILKMVHDVRGLDANGKLLVDVFINGNVPRLSSAVDILLKPYTEDYVQVGAGKIYAYSTRMFTTNGRSLPYAWNHTINYNPQYSRMPYLVEKLYATGLGVDYDPFKEVLQYEIATSIAKGDPSNQCPEGFYLDSSGPYCVDHDECSRGVCSHVCLNKPGGFTCSCPDGMMLNTDGQTCKDVDECQYNNGGCSDRHECVNTDGSFRCVVNCETGYRRSSTGTNCVDINECRVLRNLCEHHCLNTMGSYRCSCQRGYNVIGTQGRCIDINECEGRNPCPSDKECENTPGGFNCINTCDAGFRRAPNGTCVDIDECRQRQNQCSYNQMCQNTYGGYSCLCPRGYRSDGIGKPCLDINECRQSSHVCRYQCRNLRGTYECICRPGETRLSNRKGCAGIEWGGSNEVLRLEGSLKGACDKGKEFVDGQCRDIDECQRPGTCQHECVNTDGSYYCTCPTGYKLSRDGRICQDIDECLEQSVNCNGPNKMCFNKRGSYECIDTPCPPEYTRQESSGYCIKDCPYPKFLCGNPEFLEYRTVALPYGIAGHQDLVRLVTFTQDGRIHPRSYYKIIDNTSGVPFNIRTEHNKGVVYTMEPLRDAKTYQMQVQATGYNERQRVEYQTTFVIFISVSVYPY